MVSRSHLSRRRERGYTLVAVAVIVTVLSIGIAMVLPAWSAQIQRDREEELVFRGLQYAEAIRVFQRRFGRFPNALSELTEVKPRSIRRMWTEPLTEGGVWQPILLMQPEENPGGQGNADGRADANNPDGDGTTGAPGTPAGPIVGVRTTSTKSGFRTFFGQETYSDWRFTYDLVRPGGGVFMGGDPAALSQATGMMRIPRAEWIGRPLPGESGQPPMSAEPLVPGQPAPAGQPPAKPRTQSGDEEL